MWIKGFVNALGVMSILEAEMRAILTNIHLASQLQVRKLMIENDCKVAVDMINRRCASPTEFKEPVAQIQYLMKLE